MSSRVSVFSQLPNEWNCELICKKWRHKEASQNKTVRPDGTLALPRSFVSLFQSVPLVSLARQLASVLSAVSKRDIWTNICPIVYLLAASGERVAPCLRRASLFLQPTVVAVVVIFLPNGDVMQRQPDAEGARQTFVAFLRSFEASKWSQVAAKRGAKRGKMMENDPFFHCRGQSRVDLLAKCTIGKHVREVPMKRAVRQVERVALAAARFKAH